MKNPEGLSPRRRPWRHELGDARQFRNNQERNGSSVKYIAYLSEKIQSFLLAAIYCHYGVLILFLKVGLPMFLVR